MNARSDGQVLSVPGVMMYNSGSVQRSLVRNGRLYAKRNENGDTVGMEGVEMVATRVDVSNARLLLGDAPTLWTHGFELRESPTELARLDFYTEQSVIERYYRECCEIVRRATGATVVGAFDHNLRSASGNQTGKRLSGGNAVQGPATVVHADYTTTSAPERLQQLGLPTKINDTMRKVLGDKPMFSAEVVEAGLRNRFMIVNVWRNICDTPVEVFPLAVCDARTSTKDDFCVFEIHYEDRIGENYFAAHSSRHQWHYYPKMKREEALLIKCWDSAENAAEGGAFSLHTAFVDPTSPQDSPDRESIEVRCMCVFSD